MWSRNIPSMIQTALLAVLFLLMPNLSSGYSAELKVLFLGDDGHHRPRERFTQIQPVLDSRNIKLTYTDNVGDLNPGTLARYDALLLFANRMTSMKPFGWRTTPVTVSRREFSHRT